MKPALVDDFRKEPPYPPDYLFSGESWSGVGDLEDLRGLERRLSRESLIELSYRRLHHRLGFALLTMDMQHRWRNAYQAALRRNNRALEVVARLAEGGRLVLLGGAAMLCTVHEDPGTSALEALPVLVEDEAAARQRLEAWGFHAEPRLDGWRFVRPDPDGGGEDCVLHVRTGLRWEGAALDASGVRARAVRPSLPALEVRERPALVPPVGDETMDPNPEMEFIPAVEIATPTSGAAARPAIMRPVQKPERKYLEQVLERPEVVVPSPADAILYGALDWLAGMRGHGLARWELAELIRIHGVDWETLGCRARQARLEAAVHHALASLKAEWRAPVPPDVLRRLRPGPLLRGALAAARGRPEWQRRLLFWPQRWQR